MRSMIAPDSQTRLQSTNVWESMSALGSDGVQTVGRARRQLGSDGVRGINLGRRDLNGSTGWDGGSLAASGWDGGSLAAAG